MRVNLPTDLLRSFVTIVDTGSMVRASQHIFLTQSALSLQMKRLSEIVQQPLLRRQQGAMVLTTAGEQLLACAREMLTLNDNLVATVGGRLTGPIRIGMVQDFADAILSSVLTRFKRSNPDIRMEIRVGTSSELREQFAAGLLDIALHLGVPGECGSATNATMAWLGDPDLLLEPVLPIAIMTKPCVFRDAATAALEAAGLPYAITLETPSISVLRAAVESGLAITCRSTAFIGRQFEPLNLACPELPQVSYCLTTQKSAPAAVTNLAETIQAAVARL